MSVRQGLASQTTSVLTTPRSFLAAILSLACVFSIGIDVPLFAALPAAEKDKKPKQDPALKNLPITELSADEAILHALDRLAYGPRPGDVERVRQMGLAKWIDQQLNPNSIDDKALEARLEDYPTLKMSSAKLIEEYPQPKQAEKEAAKRAQAQLEQQQQRRSDVAAAIVSKDMQVTPAPTETVATDTNQPAVTAQREGGDANAPAPMKDNPAQENLGAQGKGKRDVLGSDPNNVPRAIGEDRKRPQRVVAELAMAKVTRAIYSERQLQQVMDDFWFNHLNVFAGKGEDRYYLTSYERDVIQPHTLGKFKDLLTASAKSPAMLFYLDNFLSADPRAAQREAQERYARQMARYRGWGPQPVPPSAQKKNNERGLNENYGRELMELHTLGVDGGYTQKDVTEVARCFTGWIAMVMLDLATSGSLSKNFSDRVYQPAWLNQASDAFAILLLPTAAMLAASRYELAGLLFAALGATTTFSLAGTAAKMALAAAIPVAVLCYYWRAAVARIAAVLSVLVIVTAPLTFARIDRVSGMTQAADWVKFSAAHRLLIWSFVGDRIAEHPLRGWGLEASRAIPGGAEPIRTDQTWLPLHPHNAPLQVWLELGVPGAVLFALLGGWFWFAVGSIEWPRLYAAAACGALTAAFVASTATYGVWQEWWEGTLSVALFLTLVMARVVAIGAKSP